MPDWKEEITNRLRSLKLGPAREAEIVEEVAQHLEDRFLELVTSGATEEEACRRVLQELSDDNLLARGLRRVEQEVKDEPVVPGGAGPTNFLAGFSQDVHYGLRLLRKNPGFTVVAVLTLALSIGANSAIFSVIDGVLLKPLPFLEQKRIVRIFFTNKTYPRFPLNPFDFRDFRARSHSFDSLAAFTPGDVQLSGSVQPVKLNAFRVTAGYFRVLGLRPQRGREFDENDEIPGNGRLVILSDRLRRTQFAAVPDIIGKKIPLDSQPFTVVGVMPPGTEHPGNEYHPLAYGDTVDLWWPFTFEGDPNWRNGHYMEVIGRLRGGVSPGQAQAELNSLMAQLAVEHPAWDSGWQLLVIPLYQEIVGPSRRMLLVLLGAVGLVVLIACANTANLLLVRATARQREIAVRSALGALRSRLIRQMLTESLLIALLGGAFGAAVAVGGVGALVSLLPAGFPRAVDIHLNAPVFAYTFLVAITTGFLFGLVPALQISDPQQGLREGSRTSTGTGRHARLRGVLVVAEVSLAFVLLIGAGLMLRSLVNLLRMDPGFRPEHVLTSGISLPTADYKTKETMAHFYDQLVANLSSIPGVRMAGAGSDLPWTGYDENAGFTIEGKKPPPNEEFHARYHVATPGYFRALGIPLVRGRFFTEGDNKDTAPVLIINQAMARRCWPQEDAVGKRIAFTDTPKEKDWMTVVGIVGDVKDKPNSSGAEPAFWWPVLQPIGPFPSLSVVVRADSDPRQLVEAVRREVNRLDPSLAVADVRLMDQIVDAGISTPRFAFFLIGLFAMLAIILAAVGTYGVLSYSVKQRTHEFGLRMALGADRKDILRLVVGQGLELALIGVGVGIVGALALTHVLASLLYGVKPTDPLTLAAVSLLLISVALTACYIPARRATKVDPMVALRYE